MVRFVRPERRRGDIDDDYVDERKLAKREARLALQAEKLSTSLHKLQNAVWTAAASPVQAVAMKTPLKGYQVEGVGRLAALLESPVGGAVLGDEMGLGKTAQAIGVFDTLKARGVSRGDRTRFTALVVAPLSTVPSWVAEFIQFSPSGAKAVAFAGSREGRDSILDSINARCATLPSGSPATLPASIDVLVTTPEVLLSDAFVLTELRYSLLVFDEAHRLRNARGKLGQLVRTAFAHVPHRLFMTGTPYHNVPLEFYTLIRCACPTWLPLAEPEEIMLVGTIPGSEGTISNGDVDGAATNGSHGAPKTAEGICRTLADCLMVRRLKKEVLADLPPLTEVLVKVPMSPLQHRLYRGLLRRDLRGVADKTSLQNLALMLRKCANHPYMFTGVEPEPFVVGEHLVQACGKLLVLDALLKGLLSSGHRVLVFSQFTHMLDILQDYLEYREIRFSRLDGSVRGEERQQAIDAFQTDEDACVMLLSTRAGGVGITLTAADTVVLFDSDWNPQMDLQAMQRAHRVGQRRAVNVLRLVSAETIDDVIVIRAQDKIKAANKTLAETAAAPVLSSDLKDVVAASSAIGDEPTSEQWESFVKSLTAPIHLQDVLSAPSDAGTSATQPTEAGGAVASKQYVAVPSVYHYQRRSYDDLVKAGNKVQDDWRAAAAPASREVSGEDTIANRRRRHRAERAAVIDETEWLEEGGGAFDELDRVEARRRTARSPAERKAKREAAYAQRLKRWAAKGYASCAIADPPDSSGSDADEPTTTRSAPRVEHISASVVDPPLVDSSIIDDDTDAATAAAPVEVPPQPQRVAPVVHRFALVPVNNGGSWGTGGLFRAVDSVSKDIGARYERAKQLGDLKLGDAHVFTVGGRPQPLSIVLVVVQRASSRDPAGSFDAELLAVAARKLHWYVESLGSGSDTPPASVAVFFPGFGSGKSESYAAEKVLQLHLASTDQISIRLVHCHVPRRDFHRRDRPAMIDRVPPQDTAAPGGATNGELARAASEAEAAAVRAIPRRLEEPFEEASFAFEGFFDDPTKDYSDLLRRLHRAILLHGGVVVPLPDEVATPAEGPLIIVIPSRDHPIGDNIVTLHENGAVVVEPSWIAAKIGLEDGF
jgi:superfamily II DNA or RNA helicase